MGGGEESGLVGVAILATHSVGQEKAPPHAGNMSTHERPQSRPSVAVAWL